MTEDSHYSLSRLGKLARQVLACSRCRPKRSRVARAAGRSAECDLCLDLVVSAVVGTELLRRKIL